MMSKAAPMILRNATSDTPELWFYTEFGPEYMGYISANAVRVALDSLGTQRKLHIHMNSPGGDVSEAAAIYNLLKNYSAKKVGLIDGMAVSCGSWVIQACDTIRIAENGLMMIHDPETMSYGNEADLLRDAAMLGQVKQSILSTYAKRSNKKSADEFSAAMSAETWYTAQEALDAGLVDEIDPNKSVTMNLDPRRIRNAPSWVRETMPGGDDWRQLVNSRRQLLNELEANAA